MIEDTGIAERAIRLALSLPHVAYAEAYLEKSRSISAAVEQGEANGSGATERFGLRVRLIRQGRLYTVSTDKVDMQNLRSCLTRMGEFGGKAAVTSLSKERRENASYSVKESIPIEDGNPLDELDKAEKRVSSLGFVKYRSFYASLGRSESYYLNSEGTEIYADVPSFSFFGSIIASVNGESRQRFLQLGGVGGYEGFERLLIEDSVAEEAGRLRNVMEKGVSLSSDKLNRIRNVVASPEIVGIAVHESMGHANEADRIMGREAAQAGMSYLEVGDMGKKIASDEVTIIDDPTIKNSYGYYLYDDEGVKAYGKRIVERGFQKEFLTNREYAAELGRKSNASSRSDDYSNEPIIRMSNTYLKPGRYSLDELIEEAHAGVYIRSFMEWNIDDTRSFARYQGNEAYIIENGEVSKPVKNYVLEAGTAELWNAVSMVGKDFGLYVGSCGKGEPMQGVPVTMGGGPALLELGR